MYAARSQADKFYRHSYRNNSSTPSSVDVDWIGILTYTPWNIMSTVMSATNPLVRPLTVTWPLAANDSTQDWALVGKNVFSFAGPFRINGRLPASKMAGQIIHGPMGVASIPSFVGTTEERNYTVERRDDGIYLAWHLWLDNEGSRASVFLEEG